MTGKEVETVAVLLKRVRERAARAEDMIGGTSLEEAPHGDCVRELAAGLKSLAAAVEMCAIEIAELRRSYEAHLRAGLR
jgi:hypothetical protein